LEDKALSSVLKELELIDGNYYFLKTGDFLIPKSRIKISSLKQLNDYLSVVLGKVFVIERTDSLSLVSLVDKSESKKIFFSKFHLSLKGISRYKSSVNLSLQALDLKYLSTNISLI
jgi:hypothetical protein